MPWNTVTGHTTSEWKQKKTGKHQRRQKGKGRGDIHPGGGTFQLWHFNRSVPGTGNSSSGLLLLCNLVAHCTVLFFSRPRSEGWPHHGRTFSIYLCPLSFWLTLPWTVLSTSWCCPSRPCVAFLAFVHLALFLALSLSPGNSLVSSWHASFLALTVSNSFLFTPPLLRTQLICFLCCPRNPQNLCHAFHLKGVKTCFFTLSDSPAFTAAQCYRPH